ncbi:MAG: HAD family hydrolase [Lachnospiraceae bacterium]|nr:HAD family hydrolase [Lachnospiraceae bacterium]MDY5742768.1 HAD family hydrolase [Lachnospiraceae bacterium]
MIKLVASDIDGTLVEEGTSVLTEEFYQTIRELKAKGVLFAAASGREYQSIRKLFAPVLDDIICVACNGGIVVCRDTVISKKVIPTAVVKELIPYVRRIPGQSICMNTVNHGFYVETTDPEFIELEEKGYCNQIEIVEDLTQIEEEIVKISVYKKENIRAYIDQAERDWGDRLHVMQAGDIWLDFVPEDCDKGIALSEIQSFFGFSPDETMAFGDNHNDIGMMNAATFSYAVANAKDAVKEAAGFETASNVEGGVLQILQQLLSGEWDGRALLS